ncbi:MAG TPA: hypothetical protein PKC76_03810 [Saprospiraceae bacterium]|nr:hypothetical protein [Saprospiraceae bacterium]HMP23228.1 hypothetical protein [Saprospiraceae bacterium]
MKTNISKFRLIIIMFILSIIAGCNRDDIIYKNCDCKNTNNRTCIIYEQTYCADPWGHDDQEDEKLVNNLKEYFENLGTTLYNVGIDNNGTIQNCYACHCKSGKRFCAKVKNKDLKTIKTYGFIEH